VTVIPGELLQELIDDVFCDKPPEWLSQDAWGGNPTTFGNVRYVRLAWNRYTIAITEPLMLKMRKLVIELRRMTGCSWVVIVYAKRPTMKQEMGLYQRLAEKWST
jgi:hypothetical protein